MKIAMVGTRGVPAQYGGFETAVEEIGSRLVASGHDVVVYCRGARHDAPDHRGMRLVHLPAVRRKVAETLSHTGLSVAHLLGHRPDAAILFNAANAPFLPLLRASRIPVATHVDGLEWQRSKWGPRGQAYYRRAERTAVRWSDALIADARGIQDYYRDRHRASSVLIPYGAPIIESTDVHTLTAAGYEAHGYHLVVARFEPENHIHLLIEGYRRSQARRPLVVVGSAPYSDEYTLRLRRLADGDPRIRLVGAVWDQKLLDALYSGALSYLHGHSVGGTNPSLLRAMGAGAPVIAYDVVFNEEVLSGTGTLVNGPDSVAAAVDLAEADPDAALRRGRAGREHARSAYVWDDVAARYELLCRQLMARELPRPLAAGSAVPAG